MNEYHPHHHSSHEATEYNTTHNCAAAATATASATASGPQHQRSSVSSSWQSNEDEQGVARPSSTQHSSSWDDDALMAQDARKLLPKAAFFLGDLRDGLPMINMQAAYFISSKNFTEKQVGTLFLVFGLSQFLCMTPAGYFLDYSNRKIQWVSMSSLAIASLTLLTTVVAQDGGRNFDLLLFLYIVQGGMTALLPPGFNGITLGITGSAGFTHQVSRNRMMNHIGTALVVAFGSAIAYYYYPNIGALFLVSPVAALGVWYHLRLIPPQLVHRDAARALILTSPTMNEYEWADHVADCKQQAVDLLRQQEPRKAVAATTAAATVSSSPSPNPASSFLADEGQQPATKFLPSPAITSRAGTTRPLTPLMTTQTPPVSRRSSETSTTSGPASATSTMSTSTYQPPHLLTQALAPPSSVANGTQPAVVAPHYDVISTNATSGGADLDPRTIAPTKVDTSADVAASDTNSEDGRNSYSSMPSFKLGWKNNASSASVQSMDNDAASSSPTPRVRTPLAVLRNPTLIVFVYVIFFFHLANSSVLPLVMQSLALQDAQSGILLSGGCILIAQTFMAVFAKVCGDYSPVWGRKSLVVTGLASLTIRCLLLTGLVVLAEQQEEEDGEESFWIKTCILSTQFLDSVGAGILGTMQILVTSDISGGTGRFSLLLGVTTAAMCLGCTVSGYVGQALAQDFGYSYAFGALGIISLIPLCLYVFAMPETLPDIARPEPPKKRLARLRAFLQRLNEHRRNILRKSNPFRRISTKETEGPAVKVISSPVAQGHFELV